MASIDKSYVYNDSDEVYISTKPLEDIWYGCQIRPEINARYAWSKIHERIRQTKNECKGKELKAKNMGKGLHKVFKTVLNELNNTFPNFWESGSEVSYFIK